MEVRSILLVALGVLVVILAVGIRQAYLGIGDRMLFRNGVLVDAWVDNIDGRNRHVDRSTQQRLKLSFVLPGETERRTIEGFSTPMPGVLNRYDPNEPDLENSVIPIRIDPKDLSNWTERAEPLPWIKALAVPLILTPPALLLLGVAAMRRRTFTSIYRDGKPLTGKVTRIERSALVPGQRVVKLVIAGGEGRVVSVTMPDSLAPTDAGVSVALLAHGADSTRAIAVDAYR